MALQHYLYGVKSSEIESEPIDFFLKRGLVLGVPRVLLKIGQVTFSIVQFYLFIRDKSCTSSVYPPIVTGFVGKDFRLINWGGLRISLDSRTDV